MYTTSYTFEQSRSIVDTINNKKNTICNNKKILFVTPKSENAIKWRC